MGASAVTWIDRLERDGVPRGPAVPECVLVRYPVALGLRYRQHLAEVFREMQIVAAPPGNGAASGGSGAGSAGTGEDGSPARLVALARDVVARFGDLLAGPHPDAERAVADGAEHVDLRYPLDGSSRDLAVHFARVMEEVDSFCRTEDLVTLPAVGSLYALRRWSVEEYVRQYDGLPPRPWPPWWDAHRAGYVEETEARGAGRGDRDGPGPPAGAPS